MRYAERSLMLKPENQGNNTQLSYLNYLRFGSILLVILLHSLTRFLTNAAYYHRPSYQVILALNEIGRAGVPLFFMMSGYLLLRDPRTLECGSFYRRRLSRILIPLTVWNLVYGVYYGMTPAAVVEHMINQGCAYHFWFLYTLLGIYLITPFLKRIIDGCTRGQLWWFLLLIGFTGTIRPMFNMVTPLYLHLFSPLMEGYIAYFLFGYLLGTMPCGGKRECLAAFLMSIAGFFLGITGNYLLSSPEQLTLPFNSGYSINHFLLAGGIFLLARNCRWVERPSPRAVGRVLASMTFQIYFVHVLVMDVTAGLLPDAGPMLTIVIVFLLTSSGSALFSFGLREAGRMIRKNLVCKPS